MDKQIYTALLDTYRARQERNQRIAQKRKEEVFAAHPDVEDLHLRRHAMIMSAVRSVFSGNGQDLEAQMKEYNQKIRDLLVKYGYAEDYLAPVYDCPICEDRGFVGEPIRTECECFRKAYMDMANTRSDKGLKGHTFESFDLNLFPDALLPDSPATQRQYMNVLRRKCEEFANDYPDTHVQNVLLHGSSGLGKTYLMHCILNRQHELGREARYVTAYELLNDLRNEYFRPGTADAAQYEEVPLLLIDDLGMEPMFENITVEVLFNLLNQRVMKGLGTVISTNLSRLELQKRYTERFTSRLLSAHNSLLLPFLGQDVRLIK